MAPIQKQNTLTLTKEQEGKVSQTFIVRYPQGEPQVAAAQIQSMIKNRDLAFDSFDANVLLEELKKQCPGWDGIIPEP